MNINMRELKHLKLPHFRTILTPRRKRLYMRSKQLYGSGDMEDIHRMSDLGYNKSDFLFAAVH